MDHDPLPLFITAPHQTDVLFIAVLIALLLVIAGFIALYLTIQSLPDRLASGAGKIQLQIVGILGLLSLVTFNNWFWLAGILIAAIPVPDLVTPFREGASALKKISERQD